MCGGEAMYTIYMIENTFNHKLYIGKTSKEPEERFREHKNASKRESNFHLHNSIRKYGEENFDLIVLESTSKERKANKLEKRYISKFQTFNKVGYNMTEGGKGLGSGENHPHYGSHLSEEHKNKLSQTLSGREYSEETLTKMSESSKGEKNHFYGKTHSEEARRKISETHNGKNISERHKRKISRQTSGSNNPFYGKSHTKEAKEKISKANRKLAKKEAREIKWLSLNSDIKQSKIADKYNISETTVSEIKNEHTWKHVDPVKP